MFQLHTAQLLAGTNYHPCKILNITETLRPVLAVVISLPTTLNLVVIYLFPTLPQFDDTYSLTLSPSLPHLYQQQPCQPGCFTSPPEQQ